MKIQNLIILILIGLITIVWGVSLAIGAETKILTITEKTAINSLITKQATGKMTYSEYLAYIKALNDNTTTRTFTIDKSINEILPILKTELSTKTK